MPLERVHAERMSAPPRRLAAGEDRDSAQTEHRRYAKSV
jgi:hypothetical protein